ncbi:UbiD family decarboxylase [uncultured Cloacibacillus sp.]|uniref:UbiD family decarboxylase n=1 Tax=uncultured Cloacibacillus sp. TaxID=889794 RepID=UPI0032093399
MKDLRALLEWLEKRGRVAHVTREVDPEYELVAVAKKINEKYGKAVYFEHVKGSKFPVLTYALSSREGIAASLNMDQSKMFEQWSHREEKQLPYKIVSTGPVQDVIVDEPNLFDLPLCIHSDGNNGRYITGGVLVARHPELGMMNASFNRCQLVDKDKLRVRMMPPQHLGIFYEAAEKMDKPLEVAIVLGASPAVMYSGASKIPIDRDELEFAGALAEEQLEVVRCKTIDVLVPANAEIVIEGIVMPHIREDEGPFGEFTDSYVPVMKNHVFHVKAITHRKDAFWHDIFAGGAEDLNLLALPIEAEIYNHIRKFANPEDIIDVHASPFVFGCFIRLKKRNEQQPKNILLSALASYAWTQFVVVVDEDVDVRKPNDVFWAIQTRCCPQTGVMLIPGVSSYTREDVKDENIGKLGIDATAPLSKAHIYRRRTNKMDALINIDDYYKA